MKSESDEVDNLLTNHKRPMNVVNQYGFFMLMLICMLVACVQPHFGGSNGLINGNLVIWYFAVPLTYFEAGLLCHPKSLYSAMSDGYLLTFVMVFMYVLMPILARLASFLLTYSNVNIWLLKGMEVFYCMPPPFNVSVVLSRLADADLSTSLVTTVISHFGGLLIAPILLYFMLGASTLPFVGINLKEMICAIFIPFAIGIVLQTTILKSNTLSESRTRWVPLGLLLITAYHWFCDAITADSSSLQAIDVLLCVLIACLGQLLITSLCWILCSQWLPKNILIAALFTCTHKCVGLGGWILRGAYHGSSHGSAVNLPIAILPVAQLLLGSLLACWMSP